ncbi:hypothetical protein ACJ6WE_09230 [Streptomyces sp. MMS24-I31]|uniref:hypothetical protein n=1 Tax=Streptomyces sp. MMS24-I31 TaxID=3351563 RepID=UPI003896A460
MSQPAVLGYLIDAILAVGLLATVVTACLLAAATLALGYRAGTQAAIKWHGHRIARWAHAYANHRGIRAATDHHHPARKETP